MTELYHSEIVHTPANRSRFFRLIAASAAALVALGGVPATAAGRPASDVTLLDLVELEIGYTTLEDQYYRRIAPQQLLDGARTGMIAYLRGLGIADPKVGVMHARPDGRGAVPAIDQQIARAIERYGTRINVRDFVYGTLRGEVGALHDPYTVFFTKRELKGFTTALDGETFGGIGAVLAADDATKGWRIDQLFDGMPAARAGLRQNDVITSVDGTPVAGRSVDAAGQLLRGRVGSVVRLDVIRDGAPLAQPIAVVRAVVTPPDVSAHMLPGDVGYLALRTFGANAGDEVHAALRRLESQGARAIVFDLRNDGGGYESAAVKVASAFVPGGPIVSQQANHGKRRVTQADGTALPHRPLVVLVNHDSASGSELVTAAIQDHKLGTVVGTRTYGKGLVQSMIPLPDGSAMKVTTARYYTASGRDIDRIGVTPDVAIEEAAGSTLGTPGSDAQLDRALAILAGGM